MESAERKSFFRYENGIVTMMFFTFGFVFMERLSVVYLFPFIAPDLKLNNAQTGLIVSVLAVCWAISGFIFGSLSDLIGSRKKVLLPVTLAFALFSFLSGLARNLGTMLVVRGLMGVSEGPALPLAQASVIADSSEKRRGFNLGFVQSATGLIGATFTPIIMTAVAVRYSWHAAFYVVGIPGIIMFIVLGIWMREPSKQQKSEVAEDLHKVKRSDLGEVFKHRNIWISMVISMFFMTWLFAFTTFAPTFLIEADHFSPQAMGVIMAGAGLGSFVWGFVGPAVSDRLGRKFALVFFGLVAALAPVFLALVHASVGTMVIILFLTTVGQACFPLFMAIVPGESLPVKYVATAVGLTQLIGELTGGTLAPWLGGVAADSFGLSAPLYIAAGGAFISAILAIGIKETAPVKIRKKAAKIRDDEVPSQA